MSDDLRVCDDHVNLSKNEMEDRDARNDKLGTKLIKTKKPVRLITLCKRDDNSGEGYWCLHFGDPTELPPQE